MTVDIEKLKRPDPCPQGFTDYNMGWNECIDYLHSRGYLGGVADGYVLVPKEPTTNMCDAGVSIFDCINNGDDYGAEQIYKAMIAAAPNPSRPEKSPRTSSV